MSKQKASKLDQFAETLLVMDGEKKTLAEMIAWLKAEGCVVSSGRLSEFLQSQRQRQAQALMLEQISTGARAVKEIEERFAENPAPALETLIKLYRVLILKLSTQGNADPSLIELATAMTKQAMDYEKLDVKRQELELNREKFEALERQNQAAKEVVNSTLTPEQQRDRLKEILK